MNGPNNIHNKVHNGTAAADDNEDRYQDVLEQIPPQPIQLIDHTASEVEHNGSANGNGAVNASQSEVWAKDVHIDQYETIQGSTRAGAYVVYLIRIDTHVGDCIRINKRYSEFDALRLALVEEFPKRINEIPELPPKSMVSKFRSAFLKHRQTKLQYFLLCILLNPVFARSSIVKQFIKS